MSRIQKGKKPVINLEPEVDQPQNGFKVSLQKPTKIKSNLIELKLAGFGMHLATEASL